MRPFSWYTRRSRRGGADAEAVDDADNADTDALVAFVDVVASDILS